MQFSEVPFTMQNNALLSISKYVVLPAFHSGGVGKYAKYPGLQFGVEGGYLSLGISDMPALTINAVPPP